MNIKKILLGFVAASVVVGVISGIGDKQKNNTASTSTQTQAVQKVDTTKANKEVIDALGTFYKSVDEVEKLEWYMPYEGNIPAETKVYWYVGLNSEDEINQRVKIVHFSDGFNWVFWDKVIFSNDKGKWEYKIGSFAGQSGKGKSTHIVMGGKYEILDLPIGKLIDGLNVVTTGNNPIIRLAGEKYNHDIKLSSEDIENLKRAVTFYNNAKIIKGKITRAK